MTTNPELLKRITARPDVFGGAHCPRHARVRGADTEFADPGDRALLELAEAEDRVLTTIDADFAELIYLHDVSHAGLIRLPDVPAEQRIQLMAEIITRHQQALETHSIVTIRGGRIRISRPPVM